MRPVLTTEIARDIDKRASHGMLLKSYSFMQRASQGIADAVEKVHTPEEGEVVFLCGKGNNGGDGYLAARILRDRGYETTCFSLESPEKLNETAGMAYEEYCSLGGIAEIVGSTADLPDFSHYSIIVDAMLGTGLTGNPRGLYAEVIAMLNETSSFVISIDTPSGMNGDTAQPGNPTVIADLTIIPGYPRSEHLFYPGREWVGDWIIRDLGYETNLLPPESSAISLFEMSDLDELLPPRRPDGNKYTHGTVSVIAGSRGMTGAVSLTAEAVLRSGAGMCYTIVPKSIMIPLSIKITEPVLMEVPETEEGSIARDIEQTLQKVSGKSRVMLIGPGLSRNEETAEMVRDTLKRISTPIVLDGDGLNAFIDNPYELKAVHDLVITPHEGEWVRLFGEIPVEPMKRIERVATVAKEYKMTALLKGAPTLIADQQGRVIVVPAGNSGMATAGSGDVLTGIIAGLIAQGAQTNDAAVAGVALHGIAGDCAADRVGEYALIASDILDSLGEAFLAVDHRSSEELH